MEDEALVPPCDHGHGDVDVDDDWNYAAADDDDDEAKKVDEALVEYKAIVPPINHDGNIGMTKERQN